MDVRFVQPGEGAAVVSLAALVHGSTTDVPLQAAVDRYGGQIPIPELLGAVGLCFVAVEDDQLVGVVYACTPVGFVSTFPIEQQNPMIHKVLEIEIVAVAETARQRGVGTALLTHLEDHVASRGPALVAKVAAGEPGTLRWYRHRGYTLAQPNEPFLIPTPNGSAGLDAGTPHWRLAVKAPHRCITRSAVGLHRT